MPNAYVLITTEPGLEAEVQKELDKLKGVTEAHAVYGVYDVIVQIHAESMSKLKDLVRRIRRRDKVRSTLTMIVMEN
jgi:DNA-binding Lrp family transcriptional regulator